MTTNKNITYTIPDYTSLQALSDTVASLLLPQSIGADFRGDLLRLARKGSIKSERLLSSPQEPIRDIVFVLQGGLYTYVHHNRSVLHAGKRVVLDLYPPGTFLIPFAVGSKQSQTAFTEAEGDTELLLIPLDEFMELTQRHAKAGKLLKRIGQAQQARQQAKHAGLTYTNAEGKLRWMKTHYPYFYRYLRNQCLASYLGVDTDTAKKKRFKI